MIGESGFAAGKNPRNRFGRFGGVNDGSGCNGADRAVVEPEAVVVVVELDINDSGGVGEVELQKKYWKLVEDNKTLLLIC